MKTIAMPFLLGGALLSSAAAFAADPPHWTYAGEEGPENWATIAPEFGSCAGKNQSPINLTGFIEADLAPIQFAYSAGGSEVVNNGHAVQVNYAAGSSISLDGVQFDLKQFHFHAPTSNTCSSRNMRQNWAGSNNSTFSNRSSSRRANMSVISACNLPLR